MVRIAACPVALDTLKRYGLGRSWLLSPALKFCGDMCAECLNLRGTYVIKID